MASVVYTLGKLLELAGMLLMPLALYVGYTIPGSAGMSIQLKYLCAGVALFAVGRSLESTAGEPDAAAAPGDDAR